ncbi:MAG: methionine--tRNA ligase, partial [Candidatus Altiarchaeota archaeon]|nr:methionine--tRNA ligase [Candidatus Altiarchaeota archaeon]
CKSVDQRGDQCEKCGKQLEPDELLESYCIICRSKPEMRETKHWFFRLSELSEPLRKWILGNPHWPENARNFALGWIREGLQDRAITRDLSWGIPVPLKEAGGKVLYVWFDAPIGYISSTMEWAVNKGKPDEWRKYWTAPTKIVHFIGKDNIPFHTIIWPATLMAEGSYQLPWQIASNEFLNLEGEKVSTSRGWVIWLHDILNEFDADSVRYYLISIAPETHDSDFNLNEFQEKVNKELIGTLGNFINRTLSFIEKNGGVIPEPGEFDAEDKIVIEAMEKAPAEVGGWVEKLSAKNALSSLLSLAQKGNEYFQHKEPWKNENKTTLYVCANLVRTIAVLMHPFLPYSAQKVWAMLGEKGALKDEKWADAGKLRVKPGRKISGVGVLYVKIEDERIKDFKEKFLHTKKSEVKEVKKMPEVDYTEFEKMDIRVGVVKNVEDHPNANKLLLLKVDLGDLGIRQIVAGVKETYTKESLLEKQIIVITNLKPAKIRGVESQGMLLAAADDEGKAIILSPDKKANAGAKIK